MPNNRIFQPQSHIVTNITNAKPAVVTTQEDHQYRVGDIVRINIPGIPFDQAGWGMRELNQKVVTVTGISSTTEFAINVDSTAFEPWIDADNDKYVPQVVPVGQVADTQYGASVNTLPSLVRPYT